MQLVTDFLPSIQKGMGLGIPMISQAIYHRQEILDEKIEDLFGYYVRLFVITNGSDSLDFKCEKNLRAQPAFFS